MLKVRLLSSLLLLPLVLAVFIYGNQWLVLVFLGVCVVLSVREAAAMLMPALTSRFAPVGVGVGTNFSYQVGTAILLGLLMLWGNGGVGPAFGKGLIMASLLFCFIWGVINKTAIEIKTANALGVLTALVFGALPWVFIWDLYIWGGGPRYLLLLMAVAWCGDTGGYFGGRFFGGKVFKSKMAPIMSPNKTWEGAFFGLIMSVVGAFLISSILETPIGAPETLALCGLFGGILGQLGDLSESTIKRFAGVKDSGNLIPGHGGFLDRVDGILFAAPVIWIILYHLK
jgi:phosphatidate cytidylyltransferase